MSFSPQTVRTRVIEFLRQHDFPAGAIKLPLLEKFVFKSGIEVAEQLVTLYALAGLAHDADPQALKDWLVDIKLYSELSPYDKAIFDKSALSEKEVINLSWKQESLYLLAWAGAIVDNLGLPYAECNLSKVFPNVPPETEPRNFLKQFALRPEAEIAFQADLHYCLHWIYRHPEVWSGFEAPRRLHKDVLIERRRALEWLIQISKKWDDVELNT